MADEQQTQPQQPKQGRSQKSGPKKGPGLAPIQGEAADDPRPAHRQPGTREHLGDDPVYAGDPTPMGHESEEDARNR